MLSNPVDTNLFSPSSKQHKEEKKCVSVRGYSGKYGLETAIKAFSRLEEAHLTIIGSSLAAPECMAYLSYFQELASNSQCNVTLSDKVFDHNEMPNVYRKFDFFVAPSRVEAQGVAMCEAMSCGLPVIATNVGGIPEFVKAGFNGLLVPPNNPYALRKAVISLVRDHDLYEKLSSNARKFAVEHLDAIKLCKKELNVKCGNNSARNIMRGVIY